VKELFDSVNSSKGCDTAPATGSTAFSDAVPAADRRNILVSSGSGEPMAEASLARSLPLDRQHQPTVTRPVPSNASADSLPHHLDKSGVQAAPSVIADESRAHGGSIAADGSKQSLSSRPSARDTGGSIDLLTPPPGAASMHPPSVPSQPAVGEPVVPKHPFVVVSPGGLRTRELVDWMRFAGLPPPHIEWVQQSEVRASAALEALYSFLASSRRILRLRIPAAARQHAGPRS